MNDLSRKNLDMDKGMPDILVYKPHKRLMLCTIKSDGCRFKKQGSCIMCDYGQFYNLTSHELYYALRQYILPELEGVDILMLGSCGSIFDPSELSSKCIDVLLDFLEGICVKHVSFETHYSTVTADILEKLKSRLPNQSMSIELGFESCDKNVQMALNKLIDLDKLNNIIQCIHNYDIEVVLNVLLGSPQLSVKQQLDASLKSVMWAFEHNADQVVLFPLTIKPFTYAYKLYKKGSLQPISHWMVVELLRLIPSELLSRVMLSKYNAEHILYRKKDVSSIPPTDCPVCRDILQRFYHNYASIYDSSLRGILILDLIRAEKDLECNCRNEFLNKLWK